MSTLHELAQQNQIPQSTVDEVMKRFDAAMLKVMKSKDEIQGKCTITGHLHTYNQCNSVWTAVIKKARVKSDSCEDLTCMALKIVTCDSNVLLNNGN